MNKMLVTLQELRSKKYALILAFSVLLIFLIVSGYLIFSKFQRVDLSKQGVHTRDYIDFIDKFNAATDTRENNIVITDGGKNNIFQDAHVYDMHVGNQVITIYEFESPSDANKQVRRLSVDGQNVEDFGIIEWSGNPHFFKKKTIIVFYLGDDKKILDTLTDLCGQQFAGE